MSSNHQPLVQVDLTELRPTQMTVGGAEVAIKRASWSHLKRKARKQVLASHWFPAVKGPGGHYHIVDHHHLGSALLAESVPSVWVMPLQDFSDLEGEAFWRLMEFHQWAHPYDHKGRRRGYDAIPASVSGLRDDPYRSLAGAVRNAGGYAKDAAPYVEFLWAYFFRSRIAARTLRPSPDGTLTAQAVQRAVDLAHSGEARHLPGWSGAGAAPAGPHG